MEEKIATVESVLNIAIPSILVFIALGFAWVKFIEPWCMPMLAKLWAWMNGEGKQQEDATRKEIIYE